MVSPWVRCLSWIALLSRPGSYFQWDQPYLINWQISFSLTFLRARPPSCRYVVSVGYILFRCFCFHGTLCNFWTSNHCPYPILYSQGHHKSWRSFVEIISTSFIFIFHLLVRLEYNAASFRRYHNSLSRWNHRVLLGARQIYGFILISIRARTRSWFTEIELAYALPLLFIILEQ